MPADPSSSIPAALAHLAHADPLTPADAPHLLAYLAGVVVTADALHTHADAAEFLVIGKHAHYLFTVKANQTRLLGRCRRLAWHQVPVLDCTRDRAHGRVELRTLRRSRSVGWGSRTPRRSSRSPEKVRDLRARRWRTVTVYALTSLPHAQASPGRLADLIREHWAIETACTTSAT